MIIERVFASLNFVDAFKGNHNIVSDESSRNEGALGFQNNLIQNRP
jgi:hypothetical protein